MYTIVKIPKELVESTKLVRRDLARNYGRILKSVLSPERRPRCGNELGVVRRVKSGVEIVRCGRCGYAQPRFRAEVGGEGLPHLLLSVGLGFSWV